MIKNTDKNNKQQFFFSKGDLIYNACIVPPVWRGYSEHVISEGYFYAANILVGSLVNKDFINEEYINQFDSNTGDYVWDIHKDTLVYPIFFNYPASARSRSNSDKAMLCVRVLVSQILS